ncbi:putative protein of unknown function (DUF2012) [Lyophyllum shimeji]|uniref:ER membrane protein complex subunit 7 beta-sandwich domain-containing protein n=1 Tax=Lyophyllum shimeji TaxID=47721 RepID=A0A9P3UMH4_LYOSH|nr:putative protein of unknown function (DUF2012) [Lyophyllum shimeji]
MVYRPLLLALSCLLSFSYALDLTGKVQWNEDCPDIRALRSSKVILDNGRMKGSILHDGSFSIPDVPTGTYLLSVVSPDYSFDQLRVDVVDSVPAPEIRPYVAGTPLNPFSTILLPYPITLTPRQKHAYFAPHESFNLVAMLSNPMMLMMIVGGAMMLAMPYLMKNMDPEAMEEFKEQHAKVSGFQNAIANGDLKSGLTAIMGDEEHSKAAGAHQSSPAGTKNRGPKNRKR